MQVSTISNCLNRVLFSVYVIMGLDQFRKENTMPRITKIYTRTGDDGTTALGTKTRVAKDHPRITTYGTVDELNAIIGVALAAGRKSVV